MHLIDWCFKCDDERYEIHEEEEGVWHILKCSDCGSLGPKHYYLKIVKKKWTDIFKSDFVKPKLGLFEYEREYHYDYPIIKSTNIF